MGDPLVSEPLGRVVATERKPNTPHEFHFWTSLDCPVGIGTIVRVDGSHPVNGQIPHIYGIVVEGFSYTDLQSPMHDVLGHDGSPANAGFAVDRASGDPPLHCGSSAADPRGAAAAGADGRGFPRGRGRCRHRAANGRLSEGRREHRNSGRSLSRRRDGFGDLSRRRLSARSRGGAPQHLGHVGPRDEDERRRVAARFGVHPFSREQRLDRGGVLQRERSRPLLPRSAGDRSKIATASSTRRWASKAAPFENVQYFAPYTAKGFSLNTLRSNEALLHNVKPLTWGLREVLQYAEVLLNKDDIDAKADALIDFISERVVDRAFETGQSSVARPQGPVVRRSRGLVQRSAAGNGASECRFVANAPHRDD